MILVMYYFKEEILGYLNVLIKYEVESDYDFCICFYSFDILKIKM